jgi:hypothetical protein
MLKMSTKDFERLMITSWDLLEQDKKLKAEKARLDARLKAAKAEATALNSVFINDPTKALAEQLIVISKLIHGLEKQFNTVNDLLSKNEVSKKRVYTILELLRGQEYENSFSTESHADLKIHQVKSSADSNFVKRMITGAIRYTKFDKQTAVSIANENPDRKSATGHLLTLARPTHVVYRKGKDLFVLPQSFQSQIESAAKSRVKV